MSGINTNISALNAQSSLAKNQVALNQAMQRLSTGVRINSSKDDAAGLAITNRMTTDIRGFAVAMRNANDGISLTQTAEGHLSQITDNLQRIRELAVQASNATNSVANRSTLNLESTQLVQEINRIAQNSSFNNIKLLDGSFSSRDFQIGSNNAASDHLAISISSASSSALGVGSGNVASIKVAGNVADSLAAGAMSINGVSVGASLSDKVSSSHDTASGISLAAAINSISGKDGRPDLKLGAEAMREALGLWQRGEISVNGQGPLEHVRALHDLAQARGLVALTTALEQRYGCFS